MSHRISHSDPLISPDDLRHTLVAAHAALNQAPDTPTLRDILTAYRTKGDGDREMLLAMLNAKAAEDQRISSVASLQRTLIELHQQSSDPIPSPSMRSPYYPGYASAPAPYPDHPAASRSPPYMPPPRELSVPENPRKRQRSSRSPHPPHAGVYEPSHPAEQFPPSPYSSSGRSDSAEHSPRSRASMAIGSLLSDGPRRDTNGDAAHHERE
ncbi:hypothetical protein FA13DRAFT_1725349 [Coprinellus micaceus]|uniref:Uncharacterized protein n=1 Tax=Coprinellus micaceus TaxID=71717 RepID=A0A4Y7TYV3_COPMI|nr:hypothetical protein FA13DRAFT_1725349 [Coprinellus micaceus]